MGIWVRSEQRGELLSAAVQGLKSPSLEVEMRLADGELRTMSLSARTIFDATGCAVVVSFFDVTNLHLAKSEITALNFTLETMKASKDKFVQTEKLAALSTLMAGMSHELNTPIGNGLTVSTSLQSCVAEFAAALAKGVKRSELLRFIEDARFAAEIVTRNLIRAGDLLSNFMHVTTVQLSTTCSQFLLHQICEELFKSLEAEFLKAGCVVELDCPHNISMYGDAHAITNVLSNLLHNAVIHAFDARRGGVVRLEGKQVPGKHYVEIKVIDDGCGIHASDLHHLFEPFFTTRFGKGGSGLGLHMVHNTVTIVLGGSIDVLSEVYQGTTFVVRLPLSTLSA